MTVISKILSATAALFLIAGAAAAEKSPETVDGATTVSVEEAVRLFDENVAFIDVRKASDFDAGRIAGAIHLDIKSDLTEDSLADVVAKDEPVLFYCNGHSCLRSSQASAMAVGWGYSQVYYLRDGYPAWETAGNMIE